MLDRNVNIPLQHSSSFRSWKTSFQLFTGKGICRGKSINYVVNPPISPADDDDNNLIRAENPIYVDDVMVEATLHSTLAATCNVNGVITVS